MSPRPGLHPVLSTVGAPFLPLAFRVAAAFGLMVLHLALPQDSTFSPAGEWLYVGLLALFFLESILEARGNLERYGSLFATPTRPWIRFNLGLDILLVALLISFQGADQERFATIYLFPVLASAFYVGIAEIVAVGTLCSLVHILTVLLFTSGILPPFGRSGAETDPIQRTFLLGFATLQIYAATLVVVLIRKHLETLRSNLAQSEAVVDQLSNLYRRVFESLFSGLITTDLEGRITSANPAAEQILCHPLPVGSLVREILLVDPTAPGGQFREQRFETTFTTPMGECRIVGGNAAPIRDGDGERQGHLLLFQDLTDLQALQEKSRLQERMATIGELAASLAHELRNPMASILGCVQLLRRGEPSHQLLERALTILGRESERVNAIVTDFLEFTKPRPRSLQALWFPAILGEVLASWETDPRCAGLPLRHDAPPRAWVAGDSLNAHQVFTNLLSNARKAVESRSHREIQLRFRERAEELLVTVTDNGCGMAPERLQTIFLPFSTGFPEGTGLGMTLVYQFVQQMGWEIRVESELDRGTSVHLTLPRVPPPGDES
jgi:two-component system, NtrC family, sensor histidine kinase PilS